MLKQNYFILTGAMGAGKSAVLAALKAMDFKCIAEPARIVLKEQRKIKGTGVPEKDPALFNMLMLDKMLHNYERNLDSESPVIFDRGLPDLISYAELLGTDALKSKIASEKYIYNRTVFAFNAWKEIYTNDEERKMSFNLAEKFGINVKKIYKDSGYEIIDVPFLPLKERADFIKNIINEIFKA